MKIGVLGTGVVGRTLGTRLAALGNEVMMGSRTADNAAAAECPGRAGRPDTGPSPTQPPSAMC